MPVQVSYPGVYVQEVPSSVHAIVGASRSATAFIDAFRRGPVNVPTRCDCMADFDRVFGGVWVHSEASYGISQYFLNGGQTAWVVRVQPAGAATAKGTGTLDWLEALNPGAWGNFIEVAFEDAEGATDDQFHIVARKVDDDGASKVIRSEVHRNLTLAAGPRNAASVLARDSTLVRATGVGTAKPTSTARPTSTAGITRIAAVGDPATTGFTKLAGGDDGVADDTAAAAVAIAAAIPVGIGFLQDMAPEQYNLMCIPATARVTDEAVRRSIQAAASAQCVLDQAFYLLDEPFDITPTAIEAAQGAISSNVGGGANVALYYPSLTIADPRQGNRPRVVAPSGTIAGVIARTDTERGIWKAPAGTSAALRGAKPTIVLSDAVNGELNEVGINVLRSFPIYGDVCWGARTLDGADARTSQWKYINVRRMALYIENSLASGTKWAVFEPNDDPLWGQLRLNIGTFMHDLFRQGAFAGATAKEAYFVNCDRTTTTQSDVDNGIVNVVVGFAPLRPAEFVIISIQQIAQG